jgi:trans-aconitate 2-methyltransferase
MYHGSVAQDVWNPEQYERFRNERSRPFFDLLAMVMPAPELRAVDLGCGSGELTRTMHERLQARETLGLDSSGAMLENSAAFAASTLRFSRGSVEDFAPAAGSVDLVYSNAALHWVEDHPALFARIASWIAPNGQLAVQMPANHDHLSHTVAHELARESPFSAALGGHVRRSPVLSPDVYATLLHTLGFRDQRVRLEVYAHVLDSRDGVVEWVRGTTLTDYEKRLSPEQYTKFLAAYRQRLLPQLADTRPYLFTFKRVFLWARK